MTQGEVVYKSTEPEIERANEASLRSLSISAQLKRAWRTVHRRHLEEEKVAGTGSIELGCR